VHNTITKNLEVKGERGEWGGAGEARGRRRG